MVCIRVTTHVWMYCVRVWAQIHTTRIIYLDTYTHTSISYTCLFHTVQDRQRLRQGSLAVLLREEESEGGRGGARVLVCHTTVEHSRMHPSPPSPRRFSQPLPLASTARTHTLSTRHHLAQRLH